MYIVRKITVLIRRMLSGELSRECSFKNAGVAGYGKAFEVVLSGKQARI